MGRERVQAMAVNTAGGKFERFEFDPGELRPDQVEIAVTHCGVCHSDLSMANNEWGMSTYPLVPGHEAVGVVRAVGAHVPDGGPRVGDRVGLGWYSGSCLTCRTCLSGDHNMCARNESTIVARHGGFASRVRCQWAWAVKIPDGVDPAAAGPLFCGGITVFNPIVQFGVRPTDRVGVVGIGGLGHLAIKFLRAWGCEVTAFSSSPEKNAEVLGMGAHRVVGSRDETALAKEAGRYDFVMSTVNVPLAWEAYVAALAPRGRLHVVGAVLQPMPVGAFPLIMGQKSVSGSPLGSPATTGQMLDFCARHKIGPTCEMFKLSQVNKAFDHLHAGRARYRIVLEQDLA
jgi:uncharacterized zinc-type alcohol dehydrogenase-like protein